ncbi:MAG: LysM peptidoglycan-binding domain-containing protein [Candidatus Omnitrophota bacterium]|nr:MAG: LysM peptidoglycan-binding domain-containing protein [Candidatus Omnitrophota bacterium]
MKSLNFKLILVFLYLAFFISGCVTVPRQPVVQPYGIYHIVERGQTLYRIAKTYHIDVNQLMQVNKITDATQIEIGQKLFIPGVRSPLPVESYKPVSREAVRKLIGPKYRASHWRYITLHHSATLEGNAECFDRNHRSRRMGGLFYHFVIGNGTLSGDGEVEVGWRWRKQEEANRPADIQICLVGNFNKETVSSAQFDALVKLISVLREQYNVPMRNIRKHKDIEGKITECPGANFPFQRLIAELKKS